MVNVRNYRGALSKEEMVASRLRPLPGPIVVQPRPVRRQRMTLCDACCKRGLSLADIDHGVKTGRMQLVYKSGVLCVEILT